MARNCVAFLLLPKGSAITMLRLPILAIMLTLGVGPCGANLCHAWCAAENLPPACHQPLSSPTVGADDCCDALNNVSAILSQDSAPLSQTSAVAQYSFAGSAGPLCHARRHEPLGLNENRRVTVLRI